MITTFVTACGFVDSSGIGGWRAPLARRLRASGGTPPLRWSEIASRPYDHFGRLDPLSQHSLVAVEMLDLPEGSMGSDGAIVLATRFGCLSVDIDFYRSVLGPTGPSPALFSYTLPSMAIGEIAIRHRVTGHSICVMGGCESATLALWEGMNLIADGEAVRCICVTCDAMRHSLTDTASVLKCDGRSGECFAYAFLLERADAIAPDRVATAATARIDCAPSALAPADAGGADALRRLCDFLMGDGGTQCLNLPAPRCLQTPGVFVVERRPAAAHTPENGRGSDGRSR